MADDEPRITAPESGRRWQRPFGRSSGDSDTDGRPGGPENSREYDRTYNPEGENEQTNLLENANEMELRRAIARRRRQQKQAYDDSLKTMSQVQFWHGVGKFILPDHNSWRAHFALVDHGPADLHFDPKEYPFFDKIIAEKAAIPALTDRNHPNYADYEGLRTNLAVLRNFIFTDTFRDGSFDAGDEEHVPRLVGIATELGTALGGGQGWLSRVFVPGVNRHVAMVEGEGAAELYEHLLARQRTAPTPLEKLRDAVLVFMGQPLREWNLPPLAETPFSEAGLNMPLFPKGAAPGIAPAQAEAAQPKHSLLQDAATVTQAFVAAAAKLEDRTRRFRPVAEMDEPAREEAIELAREILRKLKNMTFEDPNLEVALDEFAPKTEKLVEERARAEQREMEGPQIGATMGASGRQKIEDVRLRKLVKQTNKVAQIIEIYTTYLEMASEGNEDILRDPRVEAANEAVGEYIHTIKLMAAKEIPNSIAAAQQIGADATFNPAEWEEMHHRAADRLKASIDGAMEELVSELDQQQQDQERDDDEIAVEAIEASLLTADHRKRRRRRRQSKSSGFGGKKQLKTHLALTADDYVLKQGRFREAHNQVVRAEAPRSAPPEAIVTAPMQGLRAEAMEAVRQLGGALKQATESGRELAEAAQKAAAEQQAEQAANPVAPQTATQQLAAERNRPNRRNNQNSKNNSSI